jgi:methionine aminopeptidase
MKIPPVNPTFFSFSTSKHGQSNMEVDTYEEYQLMVGFTQDSANKYRTASDCCNRAMYLLVTAIRQSYSQLTVGQLCAIGDRLAREQLARVYTRNNKSSLSNFSNDLKGVAYPTCISANHLAGGYSPLEETAIYLQPGDLIKMYA